jgi:uncharacterized protein (TIGR02117 family)
MVIEIHRIRNASLKFLILVSGLFLCASYISIFAGNQGETEQAEVVGFEVYVVQQRWHTGVVIKTAHIQEADWPEVTSYSHHKYVEFGWGDEAFYQSDNRLVWLGARALLWPTSSAILLVGYNQHPQQRYGTDSRIMRLNMEKERFSALCNWLSASFARDENNQLVNSNYIGYSNIFFESTGKYHLLNTCNTWVAKLFQQSGFDVRTSCILTAGQLFRQLANLPKAEWVN